MVLDLAGRVVSHENRPVGPGGPLRALAALATATARRVSEDPDRELVGAIVAVPGLVRADDRTVAWAPNVDIDGGRVAGQVERALGGTCPVHVSNDADCAAYAEAHHGAATDTSSLLYLTGTVGVGAGIVEDGTLVRGGQGFAGEVGHMPVGDPTVPCGCGRTRLLGGLGRAARDAPGGRDARARDAARLGRGGGRAGRAPTSGSASGWRRSASDVGLGLAVLTQVLDPAVVVLGGYFVPLGELVLGPARRTLEQRLVGPVRGPELRVGALGIEAAALGAAERGFTQVFSGERELGLSP